MALFGIESSIDSVLTGKNILSNKEIASGLFDTYKPWEDYDTFRGTGLSTEETILKLGEDKSTMEKLVHSDVFRIEISREAPFYNKHKANVISSMIKSVSITHNGTELEEQKFGTAFINMLSGIQSGAIELTFLEFRDARVIDFLTKVSSMNSLGVEDFKLGSALRGASNFLEQIGLSTGFPSREGISIIPSDGTSLLPYDYYFKIKVWNVEIDEYAHFKTETIVIEDEYLIDGNISQSYASGEEGYQELTVNFKPIKSWQ